MTEYFGGPLKGMSPVGFGEMGRESRDSPGSFVACCVTLLQVHWLDPGCEVEMEKGEAGFIKTLSRFHGAKKLKPTLSARYNEEEVEQHSTLGQDEEAAASFP